MNICFRVRNGGVDSEKEFLQGAEKKLLEDLKGHCSVGGVGKTSSTLSGH